MNKTNRTYDFTGWATKTNILCSDGRTIKKDAFIDNNGTIVPLVWNHDHDSPDNVLGNAYLENRPEGVMAYCSFNNSPMAERSKELLRHGDIKSLSIYANRLKQDSSKNVIHGDIKEVSLVLAGANRGALIDNISFVHSDGDITEVEDEAIIYSGEESIMEHSDDSEDKYDKNNPDDILEHKEGTQMSEPKAPVKEPVAESKAPTPAKKSVKDIFNTLTDEQKNAVYALIGAVAQGKVNGGNDAMIKHNVFEDAAGNGETSMNSNGIDISRNELFQTALAKAKKDHRDSLKEVLNDTILEHSDMGGSDTLQHADPTYGIASIDLLFPDAADITKQPSFIDREQAWVGTVMNKTHHSPMSRVRSTFADITADAARAKGYVKGTLKKEEVITLLRRTTDPCTVYKKQKIDRDDMLDITSFDVVAWLKGEMRIKLDEELARAVLVGDGRAVDDPDKIPEDHLRPIASDAALYTIPVAEGYSTSTVEEIAATIVDSIVVAMDNYRGSGSPVCYMAQNVYTRCILLKDTQGYRLYKTDKELAAAMMCSAVVPVPNEIMGNHYAVVVNLQDYNIGADKGGDVSMFDDFDIDYNQYKYLIETRCSGALTVPYSAIVINKSTTVKPA